jgi:hypothetical protein
MLCNPHQILVEWLFREGKMNGTHTTYGYMKNVWSLVWKPESKRQPTREIHKFSKNPGDISKF